MKPAWASTVHELVKLGFVSDEQAQSALDRLDALEKSRPTAPQAIRYGALGAGAGLASRALGDVVEHGAAEAINPMTKLLPRRYAAAAVTGGLMAGVTPMIRSALDRRTEEKKLRSYLAQPAPAPFLPSGVDIPDTEPKQEI